jgi:hypothetical protein
MGLADDFFNLRFAQAGRAVDYGLDPEVWRQLSVRMLTPLLFASLDADLVLFGASPRAFYLHQLVSLGLAAAALYALLRLWVERHWALLGGLLFLGGAPVASLAPLLMVRHYPECVLLAALAVVAWVLSLRADRPLAGWGLATASAVLWLAAAAAKEIAVPIVLLLPLVREGAPTDRIRRLAPHGVALLVYVLYRWRMLGTLGGGYGWAVEPADWPRLAGLLPLRVGRELLGAPSVAAWIALALVLAGAAIAAARGASWALLSTLALLAALLPVLPVSSEVVPRYAVAAWVVLVVAFVFGARSLRRLRSVAWVALLAVLLANRQGWSIELARARRMSVENRALVTMAAGDVLRTPLGPPASLRQLQSFAPEFLRRQVTAGWFYDDVYLCLHGQAVERLWQYDERSGRVLAVATPVAVLSRETCGAALARRPLVASFRHDEGVLWWRLGPYADGSWRLVFADGVEAFEVPRRGGFQLGSVGELAVRVRYDSPRGWRTYSPPLRMDFARRDRYSWRRPSR